MNHILVADDVKDMRDLLVQMIETLGYQAHQASTGKEVLDIISEEDTKIDLILMDIDMPSMNGIVAMQKIRQINPEIKVCFVSGIKDKNIVASAIKAGGNDYIVKPIDVALIKEKINKLLGKSEKSAFVSIEASLSTKFPNVPIDLETTVVEISEVSLKLESEIPFKTKQNLDLIIPKLSALLEHEEVFNCFIEDVENKGENNKYLLSCSFIGMHETLKAKIRSLTMFGKKITD